MGQLLALPVQARRQESCRVWPQTWMTATWSWLLVWPERESAALVVLVVVVLDEAATTGSAAESGADTALPKGDSGGACSVRPSRQIMQSAIARGGSVRRASYTKAELERFRTARRRGGAAACR